MVKFQNIEDKEEILHVSRNIQNKRFHTQDQES